MLSIGKLVTDSVLINFGRLKNKPHSVLLDPVNSKYKEWVLSQGPGFKHHETRDYILMKQQQLDIAAERAMTVSFKSDEPDHLTDDEPGTDPWINPGYKFPETVESNPPKIGRRKRGAAKPKGDKTQWEKALKEGYDEEFIAGNPGYIPPEFFPSSDEECGPKDQDTFEELGPAFPRMLCIKYNVQPRRSAGEARRVLPGESSFRWPLKLQRQFVVEIQQLISKPEYNINGQNIFTLC